MGVVRIYVRLPLGYLLIFIDCSVRKVLGLMARVVSRDVWKLLALMGSTYATMRIEYTGE